MKKFLTGILLFTLHQSCTSVGQKQTCLASLDGETPCRPFRAGIIKVNPEFDAIKPLASIDEAGWVQIDGDLVGSPSSDSLARLVPRSNESRWWHKLKSPVAGPIAAFKDSIVISLRDGTVQKLNAKTGKVLWQQNIGKFIARKPILYNGKLLLVTVQQKLFRINYGTGKTEWIYDGGQPTGLVISSAAPPLVAGQTVFLGTSEGVVHGVSLEYGKRKFLFDPGQKEFRFRDVVGNMANFNGGVLVSRYDGLVFSLSADGNRRVLWEKKLSAITTSFFRNGMLYVTTLNGHLHAIDGKSGREVWKTPIGAAGKSITVGEKIVYVAGSHGRLAAVDSKSGELLWHDDIGGTPADSPVLIGDILYFATGNKVLYGYKVL